jgi:hypothetical protein
MAIPINLDGTCIGIPIKLKSIKNRRLYSIIISNLPYKVTNN